jgi:hypothetical protein
VHAAVRLTDAAGREVVAEATSAPTADRTAPRIFGARLGVDDPLEGWFVEGESIPFVVSYEENSALTWMIYHVGSPFNVTDSFPVTGFHEGDDRGVRVREGWSGAAAITVRARDRGGNLSNPLASAPGAFRFYPRSSRTVRTARIEGVPRDVSTGPGALFVAGFLEVHRVPLASMQPERVFEFGGDTIVRGVDVSPDGRWLWVGGWQSVKRLDLEGVEGIQTISLPTPVQGIRVAANGRAFVVSDGQGGEVWEVTETGSKLRRVQAQWLGGAEPGRTPSGSHIYFDLRENCSRLYNSAGNSFSGCLPSRSLSVSLDAFGARVALGREIFRTSDGSRTLAAPHGYFSSHTSVLSPDAAHLYLASGAGVDRVSVAEQRVVERIRLPELAAGSVVTRLLFVDGRTLAAVRRVSPASPERPYTLVHVLEP